MFPLFGKKVGGERNESFFAFFTFPQDWCEPRDNMRIETKSMAASAVEHDFVFTKDIVEAEEEAVAVAVVLPW